MKATLITITTICFILFVGCASQKQVSTLQSNIDVVGAKIDYLVKYTATKGDLSNLESLYRDFSIKYLNGQERNNNIGIDSLSKDDLRRKLLLKKSND